MANNPYADWQRYSVQQQQQNDILRRRQPDAQYSTQLVQPDYGSQSGEQVGGGRGPARIDQSMLGGQSGNNRPYYERFGTSWGAPDVLRDPYNPPPTTNNPPANPQQSSGEGGGRTTTINGVTYDEQGRPLDGIGNVNWAAMGNDGGGGGGGGGNNGGGAPPPMGWADWYATRYQSGENNPPPGYYTPGGQWPGIPSLQEFMNTPLTPEEQGRLNSYMQFALPFMQGASADALANRQAGLGEAQFGYQTQVTDPFNMGMATRQQNYNELTGNRNYELAQNQQALDAEMAQRGMSVTERKQALDEMTQTAQLGLQGRELDAKIEDLANRFGLDQETARATIDLNKQKLALDETLGLGQLGLGQQEQENRRQEIANKYGVDMTTLSQQADQFAQGLAEQRRQADQQYQLSLQQLDAQVTQAARNSNLTEMQIKNTDWYQRRQAEIDQQRANTEKQLGLGQLGVAQQQAGTGQYSAETERTLGQGNLDLQRLLGLGGLDIQKQQLVQNQQQFIQNLQEQARQANLAAYGRNQAPNMQWLRRS